METVTLSDPFSLNDQEKKLKTLNKIKASVPYFLSNFYFSPNNSPLKTMKNVFISSKKLFSFSRYYIFCISIFPFLSSCQLLLQRLFQDKS